MTFFSEKGGVGKSSFTIMYASWLKYNYGVKVGVADFNERLSDYRKNELDEINAINEQIRNGKRKGEVVDIDMDNIWPIESLVDNDRIKILKAMPDLANKECSWWLENAIRKSFTDMDVVLLDFPGAITEGSYKQTLIRNMIGLTVIPTDNDPQTSQSTLVLHRLLEEIKARSNGRVNTKHCAFINCIRMSSAKETYIKVAKAYMNEGIDILPDMLSFSDQMKKISEVDIMRSTLKKVEFSDSIRTTKDIGTENLFIDITRELIKTPDFPNTGKADLSFIEDVEKVVDDKRQLHNTAFPDYEIDFKYMKV